MSPGTLSFIKYRRSDQSARDDSSELLLIVSAEELWLTCLSLSFGWLPSDSDLSAARNKWRESQWRVNVEILSYAQARSGSTLHASE